MAAGRKALGLAAILVGIGFGPAWADEGMWTFDNFPAAAVKKTYGVVIDQAWLDHVRLSTVRLTSGCSASIVSSQALVLTNYHCVVDCVQSLSTPQTDLVRTGFQTGTLAEERKCPGLQAEVLLGATDVTRRVLADGDRPAPVGPHGHDDVVSRIEREACEDDATLRCQVVSLYHGGQYVLYRYRKYADVRLVFAPEFAIAFFGGDPDNFNFPRYDLDVGFLRLYENDKPVQPADHLTWNAAPPRAGEPVFVSGNPGGTERALTVSQLEGQRDLALPLSQLQRAEERGRLIQFSAESAEHKRVATDALFSLENTYKVYAGRQMELSNPAFMDIKRRQEADLRARVAEDFGLARSIGNPWSAMAKTQVAYDEMFSRYRQLESAAGNLSQLYAYARTLVRAAAERPKAADQRLREFGDARLPLMQKGLLDARPIDAQLERLHLGFWLSKTRELLTADDPDVRALLGAESPEGLAERLTVGSKLADPAVRRALWEGGQGAIDASTDPMIRFIAATDGLGRTVRRDWEDRVTIPADQASERIAQARFAVYGHNTYPDATFTPRLSYGQIAGWTYRQTKVDPFTRFGGLYARATGAEPYALPKRWLDARSALDAETVFDLTTTNDIIGGNSGSPLINGRGEVIGAVFDGNIHSLGGDYAYDGALNRTIAVSTTAIGEALTKVYGDSRILAELSGH